MFNSSWLSHTVESNTNCILTSHYLHWSIAFSTYILFPPALTEQSLLTCVYYKLSSHDHAGLRYMDALYFQCPEYIRDHLPQGKKGRYPFICVTQSHLFSPSTEGHITCSFVLDRSQQEAALYLTRGGVRLGSLELMAETSDANTSSA